VAPADLFLIPTSAQGDVFYYNGTSWVVLPPGTNGQFLQTLGAGANLQWATATGGTGCSPIGSTNQFLYINASAGCTGSTLLTQDGNGNIQDIYSGTSVNHTSILVPSATYSVGDLSGTPQQIEMTAPSVTGTMTDGFATLSVTYSNLNLQMTGAGGSYTHAIVTDNKIADSSSFTGNTTSLVEVGVMSELAKTGASAVGDYYGFAQFNFSITGGSITNAFSGLFTLPSVTSPATVTQAVGVAISGAYTASNAQVTSSASLSINTNTNAYLPANDYYSISVCPTCGMEEFDAPIKMTPTLGATSTAPLTTVQNTGIRLTATSADNTPTNMTGILDTFTLTTGGAMGTGTALNTGVTVNSGATATMIQNHTMSLGNASGSTVTTAVFAKVSLTNTGTITNTIGYQCGTIIAGTQTNIPQCFDDSQAGANDVFQQLQAQHVTGATATPTGVLSTGSGTTGSATMTGTDIAFGLAFTSGATPSVSATVATVTFAHAFTNLAGAATVPHCVLYNTNAATALLSGVTMVYTTPSSTTLTITSGTSALTALTAYSWDVICIGSQQ
jgi:hypothetical protein